MEGKCSYQGRSQELRVSCIEKSADTILVMGNEPQIEIVEVSQSSEGLNVKLFQMLQGSCLRTLALH